MFNLTECRL